MNHRKVYQIKIISAQTLEKLEVLTNQWLNERSEFVEFDFVTAQLNLSPLGSFKAVLIVFRETLR